MTSMLQIFKAGTHTDVNGSTISFTDSDLQASADAYNPELFDAPLVVGHPKLEDPAYGWVKSLDFSDGVLGASPTDVEPEFAELVNQKRFPKISASFFRPDSPSNPAPGVWYLRHVGFLGAAAPALKGLKSASFAGDDSTIVTVEFSEAATNNSITLENKVMAEKTKKAASEPEVAFADREAALAQREAELNERQAAMDKGDAQRRESEILEFAEQLTAEGKILPVEKPGLVAFMAAIKDDDVVSFAEGENTVTKMNKEWFRGFLTALPARVDFAERGAREAEDDTSVAYAAPQGFTVDPKRAKLHSDALSYAQKNNCDYITAVTALDK